MELLDFTYWNKLNEESSKISKIIRIPNRNIRPELEKAYVQSINKVLEETSGDVEYDISVDNTFESAISYNINFKKEEDEIFSSVFGSPVTFTIALTPQFYGYSAGALTLTNIMRKIERYLYSSVDVEDGVNVIRITTTPELFEKGLINIASSIMDDWNRAIPEKPTPQDYANAYLKASDNPKYITELKDKISNLTTYYTILDFLNSNTEDYIINKEELSASVSSELTKIKQLDFTKDAESSLKEALLFQKKLLKMAHSNKEESPLVTDALVDMFRLLLDQYGDVRSLKTALLKV